MADKEAQLITDPLRTGRRLAALGFGINGMLAGIKLAAGVFGHSYALIADAIESTLDLGASAMVWLGLKYASRSPDATHPYGHGKAEPLTTMLIALALIISAGLLAVASVRQIFSPALSPKPFTLFVLFGVILTKEILFRIVHRVGAKIGSRAVQADAWHHRSDAITSIAAFIGISIAVIGGPGWAAADGWAALAACLVIFWNGGRLLLPAMEEMLDAAPPAALLERIRNIARGVPGVNGLDLCRIRKMGLEYYVDLHVLVQSEITVQAGHTIAHAVKDAIRTEIPAVRDVLVHVEPD